MKLNKFFNNFFNKYFRKWLRVITVVLTALLVTVTLSYFVYHHQSEENGPAPIILKDILSGEFVKVSNNDMFSSNKDAIFLISWYGCPIGATYSWGIYGMLSKYTDLNKSVSTHSSDPNDVFPNTPGLIFNSLTFNAHGHTVRFYPIYLYNQYMNATVSGTPILAKNLIQTGLQELQKEAPEGIYQTAIDYTTKVPVLGYGKPSAFIGAPVHINSICIYSGTNGTYLINGPYFSPHLIDTFSPTYLESNYSSLQVIKNETIAFSEAFNFSIQ